MKSVLGEKMKRNNTIKESASAGATSSGSIASVSSGLNFPILTRLPKSNFFGYKEVKTPKNKKGE